MRQWRLPKLPLCLKKNNEFCHETDVAVVTSQFTARSLGK
jgi:hypothetical protein